MTTQQFFTTGWGWHPAVVALCALAVSAYAWHRRFRFSGRSIFLLAAVAMFFLGLASPITALADGYLFSAHMLQHLLLQLVVPPLLLLSVMEGGDPKAETRRPKEGRNPKSEGTALEPRSMAISVEAEDPSSPYACSPRATARPLVFGLRNSAFFRPSDFGLRISSFSLMLLTPILSRPLITWLLGLSAMWLWHVPSLCSASATDPWVHGLQSATLLLMGTAFWWPIIGPWRGQWLPPLVGVLYLFSACVGCTILGIILTFAPLGVCPAFLHPDDRLGILPLIRDGWGLTPAKDQQLGGLLMWVPPCFVYLCAIFGLLWRWYSGPELELGASAGFGPEVGHAGLGHPQPLGEEA